MKSRYSFAFERGTDINFELHGDGQLTMFCLHGFGASLETWRDILPFLIKKFKLYLVDLKGFGLSSKPADGAYSLQDQAAIVAAFITRHNLERVILAGHSYGGAVALFTYFALADQGEQGRLSSLVLLDSAGYPQRFPFFVSIPRTPLLNQLVLNLVPAKIQAAFTLRRLFYDKSKVTEERVDRYSQFMSSQASKQALIASAKQMLAANALAASGRIRGVKVPTLIIWGEDDPVIPVEHGYRLRSDIENSSLETLSACGHVPQEEKPLDTARIICDYF